ncbi:MAG: pyridoxal 5'-phosphate synthase glutaminase subunit PdxT [Candidatus Dormibacteria bacterium]
MRPQPGVLALQGDFREHLRALAACGQDPVAVRLPEDLVRVDRLVIPGGESTTMVRLLRRFGLRDLLVARVRAGMPLLGTCAGMIVAAARVLDGAEGQDALGLIDLAVRRNAFGRQVDSFETDLEVLGLDGAVHAVFIRAPYIEALGPRVQVLAQVDGHPVAAREGSVLVTAFHPELAGDLRLHRLHLEMPAAPLEAASA